MSKYGIDSNRQLLGRRTTTPEETIRPAHRPEPPSPHSPVPVRMKLLFLRMCHPSPMVSFLLSTPTQPSIDVVACCPRPGRPSRRSAEGVLGVVFSRRCRTRCFFPPRAERWHSVAAVACFGSLGGRAVATASDCALYVQTRSHLWKRWGAKLPIQSIVNNEMLLPYSSHVAQRVPFSTWSPTYHHFLDEEALFLFGPWKSNYLLDSGFRWPRIAVRLSLFYFESE